jgi:spermidine synthase
VLKLPDLERVLVVDIDPELHEISRRHLPHMHGDTLADPRVTLRFGDPARLVAELAADPAGGKIDIIIADLPDATAGSYAVGLFTREFYGVVCRLLGETGIYVTQGGQAHFRHCGFLNRVLRTLSASFAHAVPYTVAVPSLGTPWAFVLASQGIDPRAASPASIARRIAAIPAGEIISYDWETHLHLFHLPKLLREALAAPGQPIAAESLALVAVAAEETCGAGHS